MYRRLVFAFLVLIVLVREESNASPIRNFRHLLEAESPGGQPSQMAPQPSPAPSNGSGSSGEDDSTKVKLIGVVTDERCEMSSSSKCHNLQKNMTACLVYVKTGPREPFLVVQNDGETSLEIHLTTFPQNITYETAELRKHLAKKINITTIVGGTQLIKLNAGHGDCEIQLTNRTIHTSTTYTQSLPSGGYLVLMIVVVAGGAWAFVKVRGRERHLDGIPYQELEMGPHLESSLSAANVETVDGWDKDWDDDWDEEKAVRTPGKKNAGNGFADSRYSSASEDGWKHDQDN